MSFKELHYEDLQESISSADFSPQGDYVAVGLIDERVLVWKTNFNESKFMEEAYTWDGHTMGVVDVKFNFIGNKVAVSSLDSKIRIWDAETGQKQNEVQCPPMSNWKLAFLKDNQTVVTSGECGVVNQYDIQSGENVKQLQSSEVFSSAIAASSDDKFLAVGNTQGSCYLYDISDSYKPFRIEAHNKMIRALSFTRDNPKLVTASDDATVKLIDLQRLEPIMTFSGHKGNVNCVDCSPVSDKLFLTCSYDKTIKLWDMNQKTCVETINYHRDNIWSAKFNNTGQIIGSVCENGIFALHSSK